MSVGQRLVHDARCADRCEIVLEIAAVSGSSHRQQRVKEQQRYRPLDPCVTRSMSIWKVLALSLACTREAHLRFAFECYGCRLINSATSAQYYFEQCGRNKKDYHNQQQLCVKLRAQTTTEISSLPRKRQKSRHNRPDHIRGHNHEIKTNKS